jgi:adenine-specific DNA-methyltransferase
VVSYNDESWVTPEDLAGFLRAAGHEEVRVLAFDSKRYVGAQIGVFDPAGRKVGTATRLRNVEHVLVAGPRDKVVAATEPQATPAT